MFIKYFYMILYEIGVFFRIWFILVDVLGVFKKNGFVGFVVVVGWSVV